MLGLAGVVVLNLRGCGRDPRTKVQVDCDALVRAARIYEHDVGAAPRTMSDLWRKPEGALGWKGRYIDPDPKDPWGEPYVLDGQTIGVSAKSFLAAVSERPR